MTMDHDDRGDRPGVSLVPAADGRRRPGSGGKIQPCGMRLINSERASGRCNAGGAPSSMHAVGRNVADADVQFETSNRYKEQRLGGLMEWLDGWIDDTVLFHDVAGARPTRSQRRRGEGKKIRNGVDHSLASKQTNKNTKNTHTKHKKTN